MLDIASLSNGSTRVLLKYLSTFPKGVADEAGAACAEVAFVRNWMGFKSRSTLAPGNFKVLVLLLTFRRRAGLRPPWELEAINLNMVA